MSDLFQPESSDPAGTSWWPWSRIRSSEVEYTSVATGEAKKAIASKSYFNLLAWHFWNVFPCLGTGVILFLNISKYSFGAGVVNRQMASGSLAALQLVAKAHEAMITFSLVNIARQWIQGYFISDGTILGLLGAERSLANLSLLLSIEYRAAVSYSVDGMFHWGKENQIEEQKRRKKVLLLVVFLSLACLLCAIAGPASAVLMIPRLDWFFAESLNPPPASETRFTSYPNIFIDSRVGNSSFNTHIFSSGNVFDYWSNVEDLARATNRTHKFLSSDVPITINASTTWLRPLAVGANWTGATDLSTVMLMDLFTPSGVSADYQPTSKNRGSETNFVVGITGIESSTVCRQRYKQSCTLGSSTLNPANASEWCYNTVTKETDKGQLETSRNLLLITDYMAYPTGKRSPRFWMTEGLRTTTNKKFTDTIVFVFEHWVNPGLLTVCSTSATLRSATVSSTGKIFSAEQFQLHEYLAYFDGKSTIYRPPHPLMYHENWLDFIHEAIPSGASAVRGGRNITYLPRGVSNPTENQVLKKWAISILGPTNFRSSLWLERIPDEQSTTQAASVEVPVGGAYISMLLGIQPSDSQYSQGASNYLTPAYPEDLMPETVLDYSLYIRPPITVYHKLYGYRFSSLPEYLSVAILVIHLIIALLGSLWQYKKGRVIRAWNSIPEYGALCLGSDTPPDGAMQNTCAGISLKNTLNTFVKIGETSADHLELRELGAEMKGVERFKKYGFLRHRRKEKLD